MLDKMQDEMKYHLAVLDGLSLGKEYRLQDAVKLMKGSILFMDTAIEDSNSEFLVDYLGRSEALFMLATISTANLVENYPEDLGTLLDKDDLAGLKKFLPGFKRAIASLGVDFLDEEGNYYEGTKELRGIVSRRLRGSYTDNLSRVKELTKMVFDDLAIEDSLEELEHSLSDKNKLYRDELLSVGR